MVDRSPRVAAGRRTRWFGPAVVELLLVGALFNLYRLGRAAIDGQEATARANAGGVVDLQQALGLPSEATVQQLFDLEIVARLANVYYTGVHFPLMVAFLVWGFARRPPQEYRWARTVIAVQTGGALLIHMAFPLAPPRMFPEWGFTDTMSVYGPSAYAGVSGDVANQLAAMPSLHVGWAMAIAYVVLRTGPRRLAVLAAIHATITWFVVVVTANHWWLDGIVATALLAGAVPLARLLTARSAGRLARRVLVESAGWLLLVGGVAAIPLPGPGLAMTFTGFLLLSRQYSWAARRVDGVRLRALQASAVSVSTWPRISLSIVGAVVMVAAGVAWTASPPAPGWWPLGASSWLPGGAAAGVAWLTTGLFALAALLYSYQRFRGRSGARTGPGHAGVPPPARADVDGST